MWLVGTIRIMLRLKTQTATLWIGDTPFSHETTIQEIARIELYTRLVGIYRHLDARSRVVQRGSHGMDIAMGIEQPVVVIAASVDNLLVGGVVDTIAYASRGAEVERSVLHVGYFACHRHITIHRRVCLGIEIQYLIHDVAARVATEAEIAVVGEVDDGRTVGSGVVVNADSIIIGQRIGDLDG